MITGHRHPRPAASPQRRSRRGFTLPEVLATLVFMGIVLPAVMRGISIALAASSHARHTAQAAVLGETILQELVTTGEWAGSTASGDFGADYPEYRWSSETAVIEFGASEIVLQVTWTERGQERSLALSTIVFEDTTTTDTQVLP